MLAFTVPVTLSRRPVTLRPVSSSKKPAPVFPHALPSRRICRASASDDNASSIDAAESDPAIRSGKEMREELNKLAQERTELQQRAESTMQDLTNQVASLMAQIRQAKGMPPVAEPPAAPEDPVETVSEETSTSSSSSTSASVSASTSNGPADDSSGSSDEPYMDPTNFGYESTAGWQVLAESLQLPENEGNIEFRIQCDEDGCSIVELKNDTPGRAGVRSRFIQSGSGYRVGFDPEAPKTTCALVGNERWLVSLSYEEMRQFKRLCLALQKKMNRIGDGDEEVPLKDVIVRRSGDGTYNIRMARVGLDTSVEMESKMVWAQAIGQPKSGQYVIRAMFLEGRQAEMLWPSDCVGNMLQALSKLRIE